jgi:aryl-alcohol dehydrogenase-like predicted oxidoreductase
VTPRTETDAYARLLYSRTEEADTAVIRAVEQVARETGRSMAQVALAWVRQKAGVAAPIIGYSRPEQFTDILAGLDLTLTPEQIATLEAPYIPHAPAGH